ncbi:MAG: hypothetical protein K6T63_12960 [Alicyclobacillus herbarius]|nr:hypothetical protein [Alicyclobacillus herbarius]
MPLSFLNSYGKFCRSLRPQTSRNNLLRLRHFGQISKPRRPRVSLR